MDLELIIKENNIKDFEKVVDNENFNLNLFIIFINKYSIGDIFAKKYIISIIKKKIIIEYTSLLENNDYKKQYNYTFTLIINYIKSQNNINYVNLILKTFNKKIKSIDDNILLLSNNIIPYLNSYSEQRFIDNLKLNLNYNNSDYERISSHEIKLRLIKFFKHNKSLLVLLNFDLITTDTFDSYNYEQKVQYFIKFNNIISNCIFHIRNIIHDYTLSMEYINNEINNTDEESLFSVYIFNTDDIIDDLTDELSDDINNDLFEYTNNELFDLTNNELFDNKIFENEIIENKKFNSGIFELNNTDIIDYDPYIKSNKENETTQDNHELMKEYIKNFIDETIKTVIKKIDK
tara:strand:+ start:209 stop:1252 length:1044 start_codon:yes stop_codon:yes gene_type:complete